MEVIVVIGAGQIGQAIARRVGVGKHVILADMRPENSAGRMQARASPPCGEGSIADC